MLAGDSTNPSKERPTVIIRLLVKHRGDGEATGIAGQWSYSVRIRTLKEAKT